ncbi:hypothetical protein OF83DRAFT_1132303 [Amylostereum chailletii]|nr:hypothetical protein OF83DRAFT_1132303 [Amylostereum chailletii]
MAAESSKRSRLIDVTNKQLHLLLTGWEVSATEEDTEETLLPRVEALKNVRRPFGKPNSESRKKVDSGVVTLRDGVVVRLDNNDKPYVFAISSKFNIDEVEALILFRSFLYNEVAEETGSNTDDPIIQSFVKTFTPFYHSERRCLARLYVPLFRAHDHEGTLFHSTAQRILPDIIPVGSTFVGDIIQEYLDLINAPLPDDVLRDPRAASIWAKECLKDQLVLLEVLFWAVWAYIPHRGSIVVQIYEAAYSTSLGSTQQNPTLLLDEEGYRIQQDCAAIWLLIMLEILDLEFFADHGAPDLIVPPSKGDLLMKSPESLKKIHHLIIAHGDSQYAAIYLAWAIVLSNLEAAVAQLDKCPPAYQEFFDTLDPRGLRPYSKNGEPIHKLMLQRCLDPSVGLFNLLLSILTTSPVFVISISWHTDSAVTDPNAIAYRAVIKGLLIGLSETLPVELIPDFDTFVEVWITLFGRGESQSVAGICQQFWLHDTLQSPARRAIFDVTRSRFPVHFRPLVRLLNAMTGSGFTDADPLASMGHGTVSGVSAQRSLCSRHVSAFFDALPTYTQVIPTNACIGPHALYEKLPERYGSSSLHGLTYVNTRPILLPGGTLLPARTQGRLLSQDGEDYIIVAWQREHSGWRLLVDVLADYARRRRLIPTATPPFTQNRATAASPVVLQLADIGIEVDSDGDYSVVTDALEFLRAVIVDSDALAEEVLASIDQVEPGSNPQGEAPSLVQLTMLILEDALSRSASQPRKAPDSHLITAAFSVLSSLLRAPKYTPQVWLFTRSATSLFDTDRNSASASAVITAERSSGLYPITRSLLRFVHDLYHQALSALVVPDGMERLPGAKEDVLLRALRFVHAEIWVEHNGWKYAQLGHRFEIGRLISTLYGDILEHTLPGSGTPLSTLSQAVLDALISKATTSSIAPLIVALTTSSAVTDRLGSSRRLGDLKGLFSLLRMHLRVLRLSLTYKQRLHGDAGVCLLEQALCSRAGSGGSTFPSNRNQMGALDVLSTLAEDSSADPYVPLEAIRVLGALCTSLSMSHPTAPTILGHLSDPQKTVTQLVQIAHHPYQEADVRVAVWRFMALAVEKEPALGNLFIAGRLRIQDNGTSQESPDKKSEQSQANGLEAASAILINWKDYWDVNPELLSTALGFLSAVWERGMEHKGMLEATRKNATLWSAAADIAKEELSQAAHYQSTEYMGGGNEGPRSTLHENISMYASQVLCKAHAIRIIAFDIDLDRNFTGGRLKPQSYQAIER